MPLDDALTYVPVFVLVVFRLAGLMLFAPLLGSARIPKRVRVFLTLILAFGYTGSLPRPPVIPGSAGLLAVAIGGEMCFGLAMGMILSLVFVAAQWAGDMVGQQMGFNLGETFDPQFGSSSSLVGDMYYMLTLIVFLGVGGHRQMIRGIGDSFTTLPLLSVGIHRSLFDLFVRTLGAATTLAVRLAAPVLVTMLIVDLTLGFLGKTMPQLNVMAAGLSVKAMVGLAVLILGLVLYSTPTVIRAGVEDSLQIARSVWSGQVAAH